MKTLFKILSRLLFVLVALIGALVLYLNLAFPKVGPAPDLHVDSSPARIQRGDYLSHHVANCFACHTPRDYSVYGMPPVSDTAQAFTGGFHISAVLDDIPGEITTPNLTPLHLSTWTDGELYRAITEGVSKDGRPLFPMMPYGNFGSADKEDIYSIIAYLRSLKTAGTEQAASSLSFPFRLIARTLPALANPQAMPSPKDSVKYGAYLVNLAGCFVCHTPVDGHHQPMANMNGAGGFEFKVHLGEVHFVVRSANITPDSATGIGKWNKKDFIDIIRARGKIVDSGLKVSPGAENTFMPYAEYSGMTDADLGAIFDYLHSLAPVSNQVLHFERLNSTQP